MKVSSHTNAKKKAKRPDGFKFHTFIGHSQVTVKGLKLIVFQVYIIALISDRKYHQFRPVLDAYIQTTFSFSMAYKSVASLWCLYTPRTPAPPPQPLPLLQAIAKFGSGDILESTCLSVSLSQSVCSDLKKKKKNCGQYLLNHMIILLPYIFLFFKI